VPTPAWKQKVLLQAWTTGDLYNAAIGQGNLEVTPLQLVTGAVAVANNGNLYRPQIVKAITDASGKLVQEIQPELVNRVPVAPANFAIVRDGMRRSVTEGPNVAARDACSGLQIAGKTGTAEFGPNIEIPPLDGKPRPSVRQSHQEPPSTSRAVQKTCPSAAVTCGGDGASYEPAETSLSNDTMPPGVPSPIE